MSTKSGDDGRFPSHTYATFPWVGSSKRGREINEYRAALPPRIAEVAVTLGSATLEACQQAQVAVTLLEHSGAKAFAALEPFLLRTEAIASSKIEQELTTVDQLARAQAGIKAPKSARTVKAAIDALSTMVHRAPEGVTLEAILAAHKPLMAEDAREAMYAGKLREVQNWIGGSDYSPRGAVHVPPPADAVPELMDDLVAFMARRDMNSMAQAAIAHAQFESIHPFTDGNGRVGRALMNGLWRYRGTTAQVTVPVASAMAADRDRYFGLVNDYRRGEAEALVAYVAECVLDACAAAQESAQVLAELPTLWRERLSPRKGSAVAALLEILVDNPIVDAHDVGRLTGASSASVYRAIEQLETVGVLRRITESRRDMTWAAGEVLDEADHMMDRLRFPPGRMGG